MKHLIEGLRQECRELGAFLQSLPPDDWSRRTAFFSWTVADEIMHLHQVDCFGIASLNAPQSFPEIVASVRAGQAEGIQLSQRMRADYGDLQPHELFQTWRAGWEAICALFAATDPERRMPWFGPTMDVAAFVTARQMEVWAHGQDIYDLFRIRRTHTDRIHAICELGVRTHGWSFANRKLERPPKPEVRLISPSGSMWSWNAGESERISGPAEDFALVVTQRRHIDDTNLVVEGEGARTWMEVAQCFAGAPQEPPAPGERKVDFT